MSEFAAQAACAVVTARGAVIEVDDAGGRRALERHAPLVGYAQALLASSFDVVRFVWLGADRSRHAVRIERSAEGQAVVELLPTDAQRLTARELDVLTLLSAGLSNPQIAARLGNRPRTVATQVERILAKLGQATRAGAAAFAVEHGLLRLPIAGDPDAFSGLALGAVAAAAARENATPHAPARRQRRPLTIGAALPLTGPSAADGEEMRNGARLAVAELNARGGVGGRPLRHVVAEFDVGSADGARHALRQLLDDDVDAIITGYVFSEDFARFAEVVESGQPLLNTMTLESDAELARTERMAPAVFQVGPTEVHYIPTIVGFLDAAAAQGEWRPANRRVLVVTTSAVASIFLATPAMAEALERSGWILDTILHVAGEPAGWSGALREIRARDPAVVLLGEFVPGEAAAFQRAFAADPIDALVLVLYSPSMPEYAALAGQAAEGVVWATVTGLPNDAMAGAFSTRYHRAYGRPAGRCQAGLAYDQVHLLANAWTRVENPRTFGAVAEALGRTVHRGVNGAYFLGHDRQCGLAYPDEVPDLSLGHASLVFQIQDGVSRVLRPSPYVEAAFRTPSWFGGAAQS